jgi:hypothetical protein
MFERRQKTVQLFIGNPPPAEYIVLVTNDGLIRIRKEAYIEQLKKTGHCPPPQK